MQSTSTLKEADPHDIFAIEEVLAKHAHKAPPLVHDPETVGPSASPQSRAAEQPQIQVAPPVQVVPPVTAGASAPPIGPAFPPADIRDLPAEPLKGGEIKLDGIQPLGPQPTARWARRVFMAVLGLIGAVTAAFWQAYGDEAKAMAHEWVPSFVMAALPSAPRSAVAEPAVAPVEQAAPSDQAAATSEAQPVSAEPAAATATAPAAPVESTQLQAMAQDLAAMGQQVEELKATIAQLKASQAQMTRELAKASETKAVEARTAAVQPARPAAAPVRKPKPPAAHSSYSPSYPASSAAPVTAAAAMPPPVQIAPPPPPRQTMADDGQPVVRPPMPLR